MADHVQVTKKDLVVTTLKGSGPGGQHRNKTETGVRIEHPASGAVGEATDSKSQHRNKGEALRRMTETPAFKSWVRAQMSRPADYLVETQIKSPDGKLWWVPADPTLAVTDAEHRQRRR